MGRFRPCDHCSVENTCIFVLYTIGVRVVRVGLGTTTAVSASPARLATLCGDFRVVFGSSLSCTAPQLTSSRVCCRLHLAPHHRPRRQTTTATRSPSRRRRLGQWWFRSPVASLPAMYVCSTPHFSVDFFSPRVLVPIWCPHTVEQCKTAR